GVFAALDQRIATRFHSPPMDLGDGTAYLRHHLALAGRSDQLFADDAIVRLHRLSNGIPRALNNAATAALIAAAAHGKELADDPRARRTNPPLLQCGLRRRLLDHPRPAPKRHRSIPPPWHQIASPLTPIGAGLAGTPSAHGWPARCPLWPNFRAMGDSR